jgi:hypothetical protein
MAGRHGKRLAGQVTAKKKICTVDRETRDFSPGPACGREIAWLQVCRERIFCV